MEEQELVGGSGACVVRGWVRGCAVRWCDACLRCRGNRLCVMFGKQAEQWEAGGVAGYKPVDSSQMVLWRQVGERRKEGQAAAEVRR